MGKWGCRIRGRSHLVNTDVPHCWSGILRSPWWIGNIVSHKHISYIYLSDTIALYALNELRTIMLAYSWAKESDTKPAL